jgi:hypothetical protein
VVRLLSLVFGEIQSSNGDDCMATRGLGLIGLQNEPIPERGLIASLECSSCPFLEETEATRLLIICKDE